MKSKFMRMVGGGVEEEHEDLPIEEEKQLVLPQISDAEIDGFYDRFLSTGFTSPYIMDKRMYVLDMYIKIETFNKNNEYKPERLTGGKRTKRKRLIGGVTEFENILSTMRGNIKFSKFLKPINPETGLTYTKNIQEYNQFDIQTVIDNIKNELQTYENKLTELKEKINNNLDEENNNTPEEEKLNEEELQNKKDTEFEEKKQLLFTGEQSFTYNELKNFLQRLEDAKLINVYPDEDILDVRKYKQKEKELEEDILSGKDEFYKKYKVPASSLKIIHSLRNDIGIDPLTIDSSLILKSLQTFNDRTQLENFVKTLDYVVKKEQKDEIISDTYITNLKNAGIEINKELEAVMKNYHRVKKGANLEGIDDNIIKKIKEVKKDFKLPENKNYFKILMKDMFIKTLRNPLIGNIYFDVDGKLIKSPQEIIKIYQERKKFVDTSQLKVYDYDETKEFGNIYEVYEGMVYANQIAEYVRRDIYETTFNLELANKARDEVFSSLLKNGTSLNVIYGFYTADIKRIDTKVMFVFDNIEYTINIETKASGNIGGISDMKTIRNKASKAKTIYPFVYTGLRKIMLLIQEHLSSNKKQKAYEYNEKKQKVEVEKNLPTTYSYNTLYYRNASKIMNEIQSNQNFNMKPNSSSMLNIQKLCSYYNITLNDVKKFETEKKKGKKKVKVEVVEEEEEDEEDEDNIEIQSNEVNLVDTNAIIDEGVDDNAIWKFLENKFNNDKNISKYGSVYRYGNNIYFGIPILYKLGLAYDLDYNIDDIKNFNNKLNTNDKMDEYIQLNSFINEYKQIQINRAKRKKELKEEKKYKDADITKLINKEIPYPTFKPQKINKNIEPLLPPQVFKQTKKLTDIFLKPVNKPSFSVNLETSAEPPEKKNITTIQKAFDKVVLPPVEQQKQTKPSSIELLEQGLISKQKEPPKTTQIKSKKEEISTGFTPSKEEQNMIDVVRKKYKNKNDPVYKMLFMSSGDPIPGMEQAIFTAYDNLMEDNKKVEAFKKGTNLVKDIIKNLTYD